MLALMLDGGVPEEDAVKLAGEATGNQIFITRSEQVQSKLRGGHNLDEALHLIDGGGELHWRVRNVSQGDLPFWKALQGWREWLDAKAFQQQQTIAQLVTSSFVLVNGVIVGMVAASVFLVFARLVAPADRPGKGHDAGMVGAVQEEGGKSQIIGIRTGVTENRPLPVPLGQVDVNRIDYVE